MSAEVTQLPSPSKEDLPSLVGSPSLDIQPLPEKETNTMARGELDCLRESWSSSIGIQISLLETDETIVSTCSSEAAFQADLRLPIHPTIRRILHYYNICPAQLAPNV